MAHLDGTQVTPLAPLHNQVILFQRLERRFMMHRLHHQQSLSRHILRYENLGIAASNSRQ